MFMCDPGSSTSMKITWLSGGTCPGMYPRTMRAKSFGISRLRLAVTCDRRTSQSTMPAPTFVAQASHLTLRPSLRGAATLTGSHISHRSSQSGGGSLDRDALNHRCSLPPPCYSSGALSTMTVGDQYSVTPPKSSTPRLARSSAAAVRPGGATRPMCAATSRSRTPGNQSLRSASYARR